MRTYKINGNLYYSFDSHEECIAIRDKLIDEGIYSIIDPEWNAWTIRVEVK